jgi:hypothetical protein
VAGSVRDFVEKPPGISQSLFVLVGRSGTGKSWAIAEWVANELRGRVRVLVTAPDFRTDTSLSQLAADYFARYSV